MIELLQEDRTMRAFCAVVAGLLLPLAACAQGAEAARIQRVESSLLPITATREALGSYATIHDRLRAFGVAGLSVAVIEDGRLAWAKAYGAQSEVTQNDARRVRRNVRGSTG
jgi:CubicO group peptidase (beta-lactamase class C family)